MWNFDPNRKNIQHMRLQVEVGSLHREVVNTEGRLQAVACSYILVAAIEVVVQVDPSLEVEEGGSFAGDS